MRDILGYSVLGMGGAMVSVLTPRVHSLTELGQLVSVWAGAAASLVALYMALSHHRRTRNRSKDVPCGGVRADCPWVQNTLRGRRTDL